MDNELFALLEATPVIERINLIGVEWPNCKRQILLYWPVG